MYDHTIPMIDWAPAPPAWSARNFLWDPDHFLWEIHPEHSNCIRIVWSAGDDWWTPPDTVWRDRDLINARYGPLMPTC